MCLITGEQKLQKDQQTDKHAGYKIYSDLYLFSVPSRLLQIQIWPRINNRESFTNNSAVKSCKIS